MSHKLQSELGVTGEMSPNTIMCHEITNSLEKTFDVEEGTITEEDCYYFATCCQAGNNIKGEPKVAIEGSRKGDPLVLVRMFGRLIQEDPSLLFILLEAINFAANAEPL